MIDRRRFTILAGASLFGLTGRLGAKALDEFASDAIALPPAPRADLVLEHWRVAESDTWRWFERARLIDGEWRLDGTTTPVHRHSGELKSGVEAYLDECDVPAPLFNASGDGMTDFCLAREGATPGPAATRARRQQHGRPASRWLRGLDAEELRVWLSTITPPRAGVGGMTVLKHLTRDHGFQLARVEGLTEPEMLKLHGATHYGF